MKKVFKLNGLDCANCAAKMEGAIIRMNGVEAATVNFLTQKLSLSAPDDKFDQILEEARAVIRKIEPDCKLLG